MDYEMKRLRNVGDAVGRLGKYFLDYAVLILRCTLRLGKIDD